jgi:ligand-binding sensor domain-containing protein/signal transduction histidine kinase/DNA-binding response OmpR family regulator
MENTNPSGMKPVRAFVCILFSSLFCLLPSRVCAQKPDLRFGHINALKGLSHGFTRKITQDHEGYMWFATADGLNKYDGYKMTVYRHDPDDARSLTSNDVLTLFEDSRQALWVGTSKGLNRYVRDRNHFVPVPEIGDAFITSALEDRNGNLWVSTKKELYRYDRQRGRFARFPLRTEAMTIACLFEDRRGTFWIGTFAGPAVLDRNTGTVHPQRHLPVKDVSCLYEDRAQNLWIGSRVMGLLRYRPADRTSVLYQQELNIPNHAVFALAEDSLGRLWVGTENGGLSVFDPAANQFYQYLNNPADPESLCFNTVYSIATDRAGNTWLGTFAGVERVKNDKFTHVRSDFLNPNSPGSNNILSFCEDHLGTLWIGTDGAGLDQYDPRTGTFTHYRHDPKDPRSLSSNAITYLKEDRKGNLWIGTWGGGLNRFDRAGKAFIRYRTDPADPRSIGNDNIVHIYEDRRDNLWIGIGSGIERLDRNTGTFTHYNHLLPNTLLASYPGDILEDRHGTLWIGTYDGLCILDRDRRTVQAFRHDGRDKGSLSSNVINTLFEDSRGTLWVGTIGGLNRYDRQRRTFRAFQAKDGLSSDAVYGILEDRQGFLWISTSNGVSRFDPVRGTFKNYGTDDGLQGNEFKPNAFLALRNGQMLFGGNNGYNVFHPQRIRDNRTVPPVLLTDFKIFNKSVPVGGPGSPLPKHVSQVRELVLSYKHSVLSFEFAALGYCYPEKNQYAYKLAGLEEDWNYVGNRREATYTSLDPGEYVFSVKASNHDGVWNEEGVSVRIVITPPFWKTWWFRLLLLAALGVVVNLLVRARVRRLGRQKEVLKKLVRRKTREIVDQNKTLAKANLALSRQKEEILLQKNEILQMSARVKEADEKKLAFFANISHEIRTPLTLIVGPAERLVAKTAREPKLHAEAALLHNNAHRLLKLVNELMDFHKLDQGQLKVRAGKGDIVAFCAQVVAAFDAAAESKGVHLVFLPEADECQTWFDPGKLEVVLCNLLSNALKFTPEGGEIRVRLGVAPGGLEVVVSDTGIGIEAAELGRIFDRYYQIESGVAHPQGTGIGLSYSQELVKLLGGSVAVASRPGAGTTFRVWLPVLEPDRPERNPPPLPARHLPPGPSWAADLPVGGAEAATAGQVGPAGPKILVIDDHADMRAYIRSCLADAFTVYEAADGQAGMAVARQQLPTLIISDVMMPAMDGMAFCQRLRADIEVSHIPVILLTAKTSVETQLNGLRNGADDYITKPFNETVLLARVHNLIASRERLRASFREKLVLEPREVTVSSADEQFLQKALAIVEREMHNAEFGVADLVREIGMSRSLVYLKLKELINHSPAEFIKVTRLKRASQLLREKKYRVSDVCYLVGFTDPHYFTISFKKFFHQTPSECIDAAGA